MSLALCRSAFYCQRWRLEIDQVVKEIKKAVRGGAMKNDFWPIRSYLWTPTRQCGCAILCFQAISSFDRRLAIVSVEQRRRTFDFNLCGCEKSSGGGRRCGVYGRRCKFFGAACRRCLWRVLLLNLSNFRSPILEPDLFLPTAVKRAKKRERYLSLRHYCHHISNLWVYGMSRSPESLRLVTVNKEIYTSNSTSSCSRFSLVIFLTWTLDSGKLIFIATSSRMKMSGYLVL